MRDFLKSLVDRNEIDLVDCGVDPRFELAAVAKAGQQAGENAMLFNNVGGTTYPVAINLYGSHERLCRLIGASDGRFCERWLDIVEGATNAGAEIRAAEAEPLSRIALSDLPQITYHEGDAGPYFTSAIYLAREPDTGVPNLSFHRSMIVSDDELRVRLGSTHDLAHYQKKAEDRGQPLDAALLIGTSPEIFLSACASLPYETSELAVASRIAGAPIAMRRCETIDLDVPAETEIVIEGRFLPNLRRPEGPFGEFMGNYVGIEDNHVFEVTRVTARPDAIFHGLICGSSEDLRPLEAATAARIYKHLRAVVPGVIDVSCRPNAMITIVRLRKQYEGHGRHALLAAMGSHLDYNKVVIAVDEDVDIYDLDDVMWAYLTRGRADTRAMILNDMPGFYRDANKDHWGRLAIDATAPWGREAEFVRKQIPGEDNIQLEKYLNGANPQWPRGLR